MKPMVIGAENNSAVQKLPNFQTPVCLTLTSLTKPTGSKHYNNAQIKTFVNSKVNLLVKQWKQQSANLGNPISKSCSHKQIFT